MRRPRLRSSYSDRRRGNGCRKKLVIGAVYIPSRSLQTPDKWRRHAKEVTRKTRLSFRSSLRRGMGKTGKRVWRDIKRSASCAPIRASRHRRLPRKPSRPRRRRRECLQCARARCAAAARTQRHRASCRRAAYVMLAT